MIRALILLVLMACPAIASDSEMIGAWQTGREDGATGVMIVTGEHLSIAWYQSEPGQFLYTKGGEWSLTEDGVDLTFEYHTKTPEMVGQTHSYARSLDGDELKLGETTWTRIDDGTPGALQGAWLMIGRERDGEVSTRTPGARRTMKILSGTRFQWIAYNVETREFFGSGGGTYTTSDDRYTENIEFFSRDDSKAGISLEFEYDLSDGSWHHIGHSTKGDPMHEIWSRRSDLGI